MGGIRKAEGRAAPTPHPVRTQAAAPASCPTVEATLASSHPTQGQDYPAGEGPQIPSFNHRLMLEVFNRSHFLDGAGALWPWGSSRHLVPHVLPAWAAAATVPAYQMGLAVTRFPALSPVLLYTGTEETATKMKCNKNKNTPHLLTTGLPTGTQGSERGVGFRGEAVKSISDPEDARRKPALTNLDYI